MQKQLHEYLIAKNHVGFEDWVILIIKYAEDENTLKQKQLFGIYKIKRYLPYVHNKREVYNCILSKEGSFFSFLSPLFSPFFFYCYSGFAVQDIYNIFYRCMFLILFVYLFVLFSVFVLLLLLLFLFWVGAFVFPCLSMLLRACVFVHICFCHSFLRLCCFYCCLYSSSFA